MIPSVDPYSDGGELGSPGDGEIIGGTDPNNPPTWSPGGSTGWWEFIGGVWRWITEPAGTVSKSQGW